MLVRKISSKKDESIQHTWFVLVDVVVVVAVVAMLRVTLWVVKKEGKGLMNKRYHKEECSDTKLKAVQARVASCKEIGRSSIFGCATDTFV